MPEVGDWYWPTTRQLDTHDYLGLYSGEECRLENDQVYYDMNADLFEDEDEVYDLFDAICW